MAICSENQGPVSQGVPTKPIADRTFGLQMIAAAGASHMMQGMQEEAAERIDAELRAAPAG